MQNTDQKQVYIAYASEGGNAQNLAKDFAKRCESLSIQTNILPLNELSSQGFAKSRLICFVSTTGNGEFPTNGKHFLSSNAFQQQNLDSLEYALFALGNRSYSQFCGAGKVLLQALQSENAQPITQPVFADTEFHSIYANWALEVLTELSGVHIDDLASSLEAFAEKPKANYVLKNRIQLTDDSASKQTYHLMFEVAATSGIQRNEPLVYQPGDVVSLDVNNPESWVEHLLGELDLEADAEITFQQRTYSLQDYLTQKVELSKINAEMIKKTGALLNNWDLLLKASKEKDLNALISMHDIFSWWSEYPIDVAQKYEWLLSLPLKKPRYYSVASDSKSSANQIHLTVGLQDFKSKLDEETPIKYGLASGFLCKQIQPNQISELCLEAHPGFHLQMDKPMIWVATGTGIAPFIGFLNRIAQTFPTERPAITLYFGVRHSEQDFLYKALLEDCAEQGLIDLKMAFSRQGEGCYVQDKLQMDIDILSTLIKEQGHVYICGSEVMWDSVENVLQHAVLQSSEDIEEAKQKWLHFSSYQLHKDVY